MTDLKMDEGGGCPFCGASKAGTDRFGQPYYGCAIWDHQTINCQQIQIANLQERLAELEERLELWRATKDYVKSNSSIKAFASHVYDNLKKSGEI